MSVCQKATEMSAFLAMDVMERAQVLERRGVDIVHLEVGEPDFDTPPAIKEAAVRALRDNKTHYTHSMGDRSLREAIAEYYAETYSVSVDPDRILVTNGTSPAMFMTFAAILDPGDEVILANPHYACYPSYINYMGGIPIYVDVFEEEDFELRVEAVRDKITPRTKAIFINSPSNPTGTLLSFERMQQLAELGPLVVSDEIYHGLIYEGQGRSMLEITDNSVVLNGFSKQWAMTGWRLGWIIAPEELVRPLQKIHQNFFISANAFVQAAGIAALKETKADVARMVQTYNARRKVIVKRVREIGLGLRSEPVGAFYLLVNARHLGLDSLALAFDILEKAHVGVAPGIDFGTGAEGYLRMSYATALERIEEGMNRLERYLKEHHPGKRAPQG